jgi:hypothetical protein
MSHDELRKKVKPIAMTMQYALCAIFIFLAISFSIFWQVSSLFIPIFSQRQSVNVVVKSECINQIISAQKNYSIPLNCLECEPVSDIFEVQKCHFSTSGAGQVDTAKSVIKELGVRFTAVAYRTKNEVYLRYNPYPFVLLHIPIWLFGFLPTFLFAYKKPRYS